MLPQGEALRFLLGVLYPPFTRPKKKMLGKKKSHTCQVFFNMKKRVYSAYSERKNRAKKRREEEGRRKKEGRGRMRENMRDLM